ALHVPLGLVLALAGLRLYVRSRLLPAALLSLAGSLRLGQGPLPRPLAVWVSTPERHRWRATLLSGTVAIGLLAIFVHWPGLSTRTAVPLTDRLIAIVTDPIWYLQFPAVGTGAVSIPLAVRWAFPLSI